ncbi:MAG: recombinase RecT [Gammaproteobacteria bacterium]|nr:recombinase RecT [Gammaproteobacteria bacterium]
MSRPARYYIPLGMTSKEREKKRKHNVCAECGEWLSEWVDLDEERREYLACHRHNFNAHEGIAREASRYETGGLAELNIPTRRKILEKQIGEEKTTALAQYQGVVSLTKEDAKAIITTIWPEAEKASPAEVFKAITLCSQYGLNPLMRHLFLVPYWNTKARRYDYVCVMGITSNRLIASRNHHWTFLDDTPRISTEDEEIKHYRKLNPDKLRAIVKIRDVDTGAEVTAWGEWPLWKLTKEGKRVPNEPKGTDKGNSMENMVCIRAERKGIDMLYPADMPPADIPVIDDSYAVAPGGSGETSDGTGIELDDEDIFPDDEPAEKTEPLQLKSEAVKSDTSSKAPRDPSSIKDFGNLYTACREDWPQAFKTRHSVWKELGVTSQEELAETPAELYQKIAAARG